MNINALKEIKWLISFLERLSKNLNRFFWIYDIKSRKIIYLSRSFENVIGSVFSILVIAPDSFRNLVYPEDLKTVEKLITEQNENIDFEYRILGNYSARLISSRIIPFHFSGGHIWIIVFSRDVTEKINAIANFHEIKNNLRIIFKSSLSAADASALNDISSSEIFNRSLFKKLFAQNTGNARSLDNNSSILEQVLSSRELEIANLIKQGKANKEIAQILNLSVRTIESHRYTLRDKIGLKNKRKMSLRKQLLFISPEPL